MLLLSITGVDDKTDLAGFNRFATEAFKRRVFVEAGLLFFPEKVGDPRNPSYATRAAVRNAQPAAAHLCGSLIFKAILARAKAVQDRTDDDVFIGHYFDRALAELPEYNRIQVNINARRDEFTEDEVHRVWKNLLETTNSKIILQYHERSAPWIRNFFDRMDKNDWPRDGQFFTNMLLGTAKAWEQRIQILVDGSKGTGTSPESWHCPDYEYFKSRDFGVGMAGGLTPDNIAEEYNRFQRDNGDGGVPGWMDLESGARVENEFSKQKCYDLLDAVSPKTPPTEQTT